MELDKNVFLLHDVWFIPRSDEYELICEKGIYESEDKIHRSRNPDAITQAPLELTFDRETLLNAHVMKATKQLITNHNFSWFQDKNLLTQLLSLQMIFD